MKFVLEFCSLESQGITAAGASQGGVEGRRMRTTYSDDTNEVIYLSTMSILRTKISGHFLIWSIVWVVAWRKSGHLSKNLRLFADVREI
jgi:hypothetical protein